MEELKRSISKLVQVKIKDLNTFKKVRYTGRDGNIIKRSNFEMHNIKYDFANNNFKDDIRLIYLKELKKSIIKNNIEIYDYLPHEAPNVTSEFIDLIDEEIVLIEINSFSTNKKENPHPRIFENGAFNIFKLWMTKSREEPIRKISFIFQKLKSEKKLRNTNFKVLSKWAFDNNYLDEGNYNELVIQGAFLSPSKVLNHKRLNNAYNMIIGN